MPETSHIDKHPQALMLLKKRARELARSLRDQGDPAGSLNIVTFSLGKEHFGIELKYLKEVQPLASLNWSLVPCTPEFVVGVVNIRGRLYSVMDLAGFLGLRNRQVGKNSHVLLVNGEQKGKDAAMELCLISDTLPVISRISLEDLQDAQSTVSEDAQKYFKGVTSTMTTLLDTQALLSDQTIIVE
ncbi:MAG: chemotaxis protein CheW [Desulfarculaceae bacterium]|nr:chemotaxis protein CheW [Desulfarculaceae bacterium]MCF8047978.1 chemotaxis protein CheW [Desulfarculaceae bacterium]MCF8098162.1 chemotaxis protein CheW [Desulfarculaceae bacterium]MCF8124001.1 chemotaxis protein CheW [Desulfarculaceae bacterium]